MALPSCARLWDSAFKHKISEFKHKKEWRMGASGDQKPNNKVFEPEDPMELVGVRFEQQPDNEALDEMACSIVEEYMRMGWTGENILRLFHNPAFKLTNNILQQRGEAYVRGLVASVDQIRGELQRSGDGL